MVTKVDVSGLDQLSRNLNKLERRVFPKAAARAINRTTTTVKAKARRQIAKEMGVKQSSVEKRTKVKRATRQRLAAFIIWRGRPFNLIQFAARQIRRGVSHKAWGRRQVAKGAFIARMPNGARIVAARVGKLRLPIKALWGPSVPRAAAEKTIQRAIRATVHTVLPQRLRHDIAFFMRRELGRGRR